MIILDTNVLSELMRPTASLRVVEWLAMQPSPDVFTTSITEAEIRYGIALLPEGRRRGSLSDAADQLFAEDFHGRVLSFNRLAAVNYADIAATRRRLGRPISQADAQIAAIVRSHNAILATRNTTDFEGCGCALLDPWSERPPTPSRTPSGA